VLTGRREDRLLFDYQIKLAKLFGYEDASFTLAVEQLMQKYYRTVMDVSLLNEMLLQLFREAILTQSGPPVPVNPRFQIRNDYLEVTHPEVFARFPSALLELFVLLQQHPEVLGVRAETIRLIGTHVWLIDEEFRQNPRHHRLFMEVLCAPVGVTHELRRMNLYGVLGRYIPSFGRVVGRMQYDLFHAYTVDAHTLFVVSNLRRLAMPKFNDEFPALSQIMQSLPRQELAYLAALFHDLAKGRGGDHPELGAVDAEAFCLEQGLGRYEARLVAWLVRNHLILSITSQKKDISDPDIIHAFARQVGDQAHLDYLYVLTVSDVRGTNPKLWNGWKARLFEEFYERTKRALRRGLETPVDQEELIRETQANARSKMPALTEAEIAAVWSQWTDAYFLRYTPEEIAWQTSVLAGRDPHDDTPFVAIRQLADRGGTAVLTYTPHRLHSFARTTAVLDQMGLNVVDAPHHQRQRLQPGDLRGARGQRHRDRRRRPARRDRTRPVAQSQAAGGLAGHGDAPCAAPGAHVLHAHAGEFQPGCAQRAHHPRIDRSRPSGPSVRGGQGVQGRARRDQRRQDHDGGRTRRGRVLHHRFARQHPRRENLPSAAGSAGARAGPPRPITRHGGLEKIVRSFASHHRGRVRTPRRPHSPDHVPGNGQRRGNGHRTAGCRHAAGCRKAGRRLARA
jgi:[protein-PII] uridylyltransferase